MRLRDTFRSRRGDERGEEEGGEQEGLQSAAGGAEAAEPTVFAPRSDGYYRATALTEGDGPSHDDAPAGYLRFLGTRVFWAPGSTGQAELATVLAPGRDPWVGEYTPAGRFTVQRRFERPVVHTVLGSGDGFFLARRTAVSHQDTDVVRYTFVAPPVETAENPVARQA